MKAGIDEACVFAGSLALSKKVYAEVRELENFLAPILGGNVKDFGRDRRNRDLIGQMNSVALGSSEKRAQLLEAVRERASAQGLLNHPKSP